MFEVAGSTSLDGGIQRISLGSRVLGFMPMVAHCYRIGSVLVDAGPPKRVDALLDQLAGQAIDTVLLTHHHEDHVGGAARLAGRGARVLAPEASLDALADPPPINPYQERIWGTPDPLEPAPYEDTVETPAGTFRVLATPGHSRDHVCLFLEERRWLFAGDAFLGPRTILRADEAIAPTIRSMEAMRKLEPSRILPGHGSVVEQPDEALADTIAHYRGLAAKLGQHVAEGASATGARRRVLGYEGVITYYTRGHFSKQNLADELLALAAP